MFHPFIHVERLDTEETDGILVGRCEITPKLDGTNACVWYEDGKLHVGSRRREITPVDDNAGFAAAIEQSKSPDIVALWDFCVAHPTWIIYGEWLGSTKFIGQIKAYDPVALGHLWIFDVWDRVTETYVPRVEWEYAITSEQRFGDLIRYIIPMRVIDNPTKEQLFSLMDNNHFLLDGEHVGEGIVIRNNEFHNKFGRYAIAKLVREEWKQDKREKKTVPEGSVEVAIVANFATTVEFSKARVKTELYFGEPFSASLAKHVGFYLNTVWNDAILEETKNWVKKCKVTEVNFSVLKAAVFGAARRYIGL